MSPTWRSVHLHFDGAMFGDRADAVLLHDVAPAVEGWRSRGLLDRFFFIRYGDEGSHVRLRLLAVDEAADKTLDRELESLASPRITDLRRRIYEPETERYGGPAGVAVSERHFADSSRLALELLAKIEPGDRPARLGKAVLAQLVLLHAFLPDRRDAAGLVAAFGHGYVRNRAGDAEQQRQWIETFRRGFDRQSDHLAPYVEAAWQALDDGDSLTPELDRRREALAETRESLRQLSRRGELRDGAGDTGWESCVRWLVPSYLHLLNNRLGVDLREECYLAVVIQRTLMPAEIPADPAVREADG